MRRRPEPRGVESGLGRNVSVSPKFYIDAFIFALTGGLIAISYKWCYAAGWDTSAISLGGYRALAVGICYLAVALTHREGLLPRGWPSGPSVLRPNSRWPTTRCLSGPSCGSTQHL